MHAYVVLGLGRQAADATQPGGGGDQRVREEVAGGGVAAQRQAPLQAPCAQAGQEPGGDGLPADPADGGTHPCDDLVMRQARRREQVAGLRGIGEVVGESSGGRRQPAADQ
jgi:hypothetical protein